MKNILLNKPVYLALLVVIPLFSCTTDSDTSDLSLLNKYDLALREIDHYLEKGESLKALETVLYYQDVYPAENETFSELYDKTMSRIQQDLDSALNSDLSQALNLYRSLLVLDPEILNRYPDQSEITKQYIYYLLDNEYFASAFIAMRDYLDQLDLDRNDLETFSQAAIEHYQKSLALQLIELYRDNRIDPPQELISLSSMDRNIDQFVDGTVTVWVDKGVKVERGVGMPDIVIGSAFFIDNSGYLLTNYHNIKSEVDPAYQGYSRLFVRLSEQSNEKIPARVVGWDPLLDLALLKIEMEAPYVFELSPSDQIRLGQNIMAIGSPGGLMRTVTSGTVSAMNRELVYYGSSVQVDVPVNPGNSGGPLLNDRGQVIGVVFAGIEQFEGINFAIPVYYVQEVLTRLYQGGEVRHAWTGAAGVVDFLDLKMIYSVPGGGADVAGLDVGDTILSINGEKVESVIDIQNILIRYEPGTMVRFRYKRDNTIGEAIVLLEERFDDPCLTLLDIDKKDNLILPFYGFEVEPVTMRRRNRVYRLTRIYPGSVGEFSGMSEGDSLQILDWIIDEDQKIIAIKAILESKKTGYLRTGLTIATGGDSNSFF